MSSMFEATALGEEFLKRTLEAQRLHILHAETPLIDEARRVVTALLDALREAEQERIALQADNNDLTASVERLEHPPAAARPEPVLDIAAFGEKYQIVGHFCPPSEVICPYGRLLCSSCNGEHAIEIVKERAPAAALASMHPDTEHLAVLNAKVQQRTIQLAECREKLARPALTVERLSKLLREAELVLRGPDNYDALGDYEREYCTVAPVPPRAAE